MRKLSGRARLWMLCAFVVWAFGAWWTVTNLGLPPQTATKNEACFAGYARPSVEFVERCLADPAVEAQAREHYLADSHKIFGVVVAFWLVLPFVSGLAVIWIIRLWRSRG